MIFNYKTTTEEYIVHTPFRLREWGDAYGDSEASKTLSKGTHLEIEIYDNGNIKKITENGNITWGRYQLVTTKSEIKAYCKKL